MLVSLGFIIILSLLIGVQACCIYIDIVNVDWKALVCEVIVVVLLVAGLVKHTQKVYSALTEPVPVEEETQDVQTVSEPADSTYVIGPETEEAL